MSATHVYLLDCDAEDCSEAFVGEHKESLYDVRGRAALDSWTSRYILTGPQRWSAAIDLCPGHRGATDEEAIKGYLARRGGA